mgnify:FL=1
MSDYVEVGKILEFLDAETNALNSTFGEIDGEAGAYVACFKNIRSYIERFPTADVEPVVRCKDCKYYLGLAECEFEGHFSGGTDYFCADGERKTT